MGKTGFEKLAARLDNESTIKVEENITRTPELGAVKEEEKVEKEEKEKQFQWTVMLPERYKKITKDLKYVTEKSYRALVLEALDILAEKYLDQK